MHVHHCGHQKEGPVDREYFPEDEVQALQLPHSYDLEGMLKCQEGPRAKAEGLQGDGTILGTKHGPYTQGTPSFPRLGHK